MEVLGIRENLINPVINPDRETELKTGQVIEYQIYFPLLTRPFKNIITNLHHKELMKHGFFIIYSEYNPENNEAIIQVKVMGETDQEPEVGENLKFDLVNGVKNVLAFKTIFTIGFLSGIFTSYIVHITINKVILGDTKESFLIRMSVFLGLGILIKNMIGKEE